MSKATETDDKKTTKKPKARASKASSAAATKTKKTTKSAGAAKKAATKSSKSNVAAKSAKAAPSVAKATQEQAAKDSEVTAKVATDTNTTTSSGMPKAYKQLLIGFIGVMVVIGGAYLAIQNLDKNGEARVAKASIDFKTHVSEKFGISVKYPANWDATESDDDLTKTISFDEKIDPNSTDEIAKLPAQILVDIQEAGKESAKFKEDEFFGSLETNLQKNLGKQQGAAEDAEFAELISKEKIKVDGFNAYKVSVKINNYEGKTGEVGHGKLLFVFVNESKQVTLLYEGHTSDDNIYENFDAIIESLDIT